MSVLLIIHQVYGGTVGNNELVGTEKLKRSGTGIKLGTVVYFDFRILQPFGNGQKFQHIFLQSDLGRFILDTGSNCKKGSSRFSKTQAGDTSGLLFVLTGMFSVLLWLFSCAEQKL